MKIIYFIFANFDLQYLKDIYFEHLFTIIRHHELIKIKANDY